MNDKRREMPTAGETVWIRTGWDDVRGPVFEPGEVLDISGRCAHLRYPGEREEHVIISAEHPRTEDEAVRLHADMLRRCILHHRGDIAEAEAGIARCEADLRLTEARLNPEPAKQEAAP